MTEAEDDFKTWMEVSDFMVRDLAETNKRLGIEFPEVCSPLPFSLLALVLPKTEKKKKKKKTV